jgi:hypothetical protein
LTAPSWFPTILQFPDKRSIIFIELSPPPIKIEDYEKSEQLDNIGKSVWVFKSDNKFKDLFDLFNSYSFRVPSQEVAEMKFLFCKYNQFSDDIVSLGFWFSLGFISFSDISEVEFVKFIL